MNRHLKNVLGAAGVAGAALLLSLSLGHADGILIPRPIPTVLPMPDPFSIKYHRVTVSIDGQSATTAIDQVFVNNNRVDIEGTYIFPIPESASITDFAMWMNGEKVSAELLAADEARRIYEEIVRKMKDPALLEYAGRDMFRARVYPVPKHGEVRIELKYHELLRYDAGLVAYRYPLNTEKFSATNLDEVTVAVDIRSDVPIKTVYCPSHETDIRLDERSATCGYEARNVKPDRDFLLYYGVSEKEMGLNLITHRVSGEDGFFALLLAPGEVASEEEVIDKDVVFVLDVSGSMAGKKIEQAKAALEFCLRRLNPGDRFNVITFATAVDAFTEGVVPRTDANLDRALRFVSEIKARGGTAIDKALETALETGRSDNPQMIIFLTDGEPTVGQTDVGGILANVKEWNDEGMRIFPFGVGYDVNTHLLDGLSSGNKGTVAYVKPEEDIEATVAGFYTKVSLPVLSDISIDFGRVDVSDVYPIDLPDIFSGSQLVVFGRYEDGGATAVRLDGRVRDRSEQFTYDARFAESSDDNDFIPRLWASRKIAYLVSEIRLHGENDELIDEVVELSKEYGIITPYTSYLIVEDRPELAQEMHFSPPALHEAEGMGVFFRAGSGKKSVGLSADLSNARDAAVLPASPAEQVKHVGDKTFYGSSEHWKDAEFEKGMNVIEIGFMSSEYFDLLRSDPAVGEYLSLGKNVTFVFKGKAYKITA